MRWQVDIAMAIQKPKMNAPATDAGSMISTTKEFYVLYRMELAAEMRASRVAVTTMLLTRMTGYTVRMQHKEEKLLQSDKNAAPAHSE